MTVAERGTVQAVNAREWVEVLSTPSYVRSGKIVLPPDAGPDAGPIPSLGCPLSPQDPNCVAPKNFRSLAIGETDWIYGAQSFYGSFEVLYPFAFGPAGEATALFPFGEERQIDDVRVGPGPLILAVGYEGYPTSVRIPLVWRKPGPESETLPHEGFTDGPRPEQSDARGQIVGSGISPTLPVLWSPDGDSWRLSTLPLLEGAERGGAYGIDGDVIVGWSGDQGIGQHAVAWTESDGTWTPSLLPVPTDLVTCLRATGISGARVVGECADSDANVLGVVWQRNGDDWGILATLKSHRDSAQVSVAGISGTLAAGNSGQPWPGVSLPVAWRLPPEP
jgi:hypothetical protein